jgi:hypothetical protein
MAPYLRQVGGLLTVGSLAGIAMNTAVVLPAILLGHAINVALALSRGTATTADLTGAVLLFVTGTLATEVPRIGKRWWLGVARGRIQCRRHRAGRRPDHRALGMRNRPRPGLVADRLNVHRFLTKLLVD